MATISYNTYKELGGTVSESAFPPLLIDSTTKVNHITFGRFDSFLDTFETEDDIPLEVKRLLVVCIDFLSNNNISSQSSNVASYSNAIESFSFNSNKTGSETVKDINGVLLAMCQEYLYNFPSLLYRGRRP